MKLSKQERIAAIVVIILVILVAGVFIFIKPNIETIIATKETLAAKKQEYEDDEAKVKTKAQLRENILSAYNDGKDLADMFFPELKSYEVDNEFRAFLNQCKNKSNLLVEELTVSSPGTSGLSTSVYTPTATQYALKSYANQGSTDGVVTKNLLRQRLIQAALGEPQTIGATTVSFKLTATTIDDILTFADEVNNYEMVKNGKKVRMAIALGGVGFKDLRTAFVLEKRGTEATADANEAGGKLFAEYLSNLHSVSRTAHAEAPADGENPEEPIAPNIDSGELSNDEEKLDFYLYKIDCTITFYSIERMQDPTDILNEQDKNV